ncbi:microfibril-associated glycoprotein 4-like [Crassostrea virginica]
MYSLFNVKKVNLSVITEFTTDSLTFCALQCTDSCTCFGFNNITTTCRIQRECDPAVMTDDTGWKYYSVNVTSTHQDPIYRSKNCQEILTKGVNVSGVYTIFPWTDSDPNYRPVQVFCDMETAGGGWTIVQKRIGDSTSFNRGWNDYKNGFGSPNDSYWLGNDVLHQLTKTQVALHVSLTSLDLTTVYAEYRNFSIGDEANKYKLHINGWMTGTLDDSISNTVLPSYNLDGMFFTTFDQDNDMYPKNCAISFGGGWWFNACHYAFLNGPMKSGKWVSPWNPLFADGALINSTVMMIKPL